MTPEALKRGNDIVKDIERKIMELEGEPPDRIKYVTLRDSEYGNSYSLTLSYSQGKMILALAQSMAVENLEMLKKELEAL